VRLITDSAVSVAARTVNGSSTGLVEPKVGNPRDLVLRGIRKTDAVAKGDVVVTAGTISSRNDLASVFPRDLPIGRVWRIDEPGSEAQEVHLHPFVDLRRVEFVQVLTKRVDFNR
jgi:rod shape-determining protein MreC